MACLKRSESSLQGGVHGGTLTRIGRAHPSHLVGHCASATHDHEPGVLTRRTASSRSYGGARWRSLRGGRRADGRLTTASHGACLRTSGAEARAAFYGACLHTARAEARARFEGRCRRCSCGSGLRGLQDAVGYGLSIGIGSGGRRQDGGRVSWIAWRWHVAWMRAVPAHSIGLVRCVPGRRHVRGRVAQGEGRARVGVGSRVHLHLLRAGGGWGPGVVGVVAHGLGARALMFVSVRGT